MLRNPMHAAYTILGLILHHCPTGKEQAFMSQKYGEIVRQIHLDFETNHDIEGEKAMAGILLDGLKYGNWPWSLPAHTVSDADMLNHIRETFADVDPNVFIPLDEINVGRIFGGQLMAYVTSDRFKDVPDFILEVNHGRHGLCKRYIPEAGTFGPWGKEGRQGN